MSLVSNTVYRSVYFGGYDFLKATFRLKASDSILIQTIAAYVSCKAAYFVSSPFARINFIKHVNLMKQNRLVETPTHWQAFIQIVSEKGFHNLFKYSFRGKTIIPTLCLVFYDQAQRFV